MELDRNGLEVLDRDECLRMLSGATLGRVGLTSGALPTVLPVNFFLDGERILILTGRGSKLEAATQNAVVAFEVDDFDPVYHSGWSVVVTGTAHAITDPAELETLRRMPLARWAPWNNGRVVAIETEIMSGRRISPGVPQQDPGRER
jgi:nitroimidazol reductase NimA-like FMN-containing flavoprotein (pyridoxamine 5'-phosphate oxidase superfamily)